MWPMRPVNTPREGALKKNLTFPRETWVQIVAGILVWAALSTARRYLRSKIRANSSQAEQQPGEAAKARVIGGKRK